MQTNRYKIFSYPYLAEFTSDYKKSEFHIESIAKYDSENEIITFGISYSINNDYINRLISKGDVRVSVKLSCKHLGFVKVVDIPSGDTSKKIPVQSLDVDGDVDLDAYLVTNNDIRISDESLSKEWIEEEAYVQKGNIIGESNTYVITIDHFKDGGKQSIVSFTEVNRLNDKEYYEVDLSGDRIVFRLSSKMFKHYAKVSKKNEESIIVDFLIPEFTNILQQMIERDDNDNPFNNNHKEKEWYKVISHRYEKELNRDPTAGEISPLIAAQLLLKVGPQKQNAAYKELSFVVKARERGMKDD